MGALDQMGTLDQMGPDLRASTDPKIDRFKIEDTNNCMLQVQYSRTTAAPPSPGGMLSHISFFQHLWCDNPSTLAHIQAKKERTQ
jgi:hypothetical protein